MVTFFHPCHFTSNCLTTSSNLEVILTLIWKMGYMTSKIPFWPKCSHRSDLMVLVAPSSSLTTLSSLISVSRLYHRGICLLRWFWSPGYAQLPLTVSVISSTVAEVSDKDFDFLCYLFLHLTQLEKGSWIRQNFDLNLNILVGLAAIHEQQSHLKSVHSE